MTPYERDAVLIAVGGGLLGARGFSLGGAVVTSVVASVALTLANDAKLIGQPNRPSTGHTITSTFVTGLAGWWIGRTFFPPP